MKDLQMKIIEGGFMVPAERFKKIWKALCKVWDKQSHCMVEGSGRDSLFYWVRYCSNGFLLTSPSECRRCLNIAIHLGWATKGKNKSTGYTTFKLNA